MFRINTKHRQTNLFGLTNLVSDQKLKEIEESGEQSAEADYELIFCNIREEDFACLYSEIDSPLMFR